MPNYLFIPIVIDALALQDSIPVPAPMADFSQLPYNDGNIDHNGDKPFTGETVINTLWENKQMDLGEGVHLHWALPSGLTQALPKSDGTTQYLAVPDQWLIVRGGTATPQTWIVESSYLYPVDAPIPNAITMPQYDDPGRPFRYMGKQSNLSTWSPSSPDSYFDALSAVGYGELSFAAYYPNCYSVFGFHDDDIHYQHIQGAKYTIIGLYRDTNADALHEFVQNNAATEPEAILAAIEETFQWALPSNSAVPDYILCYGVIAFNSPSQSQGDQSPNAEITIGNSGTEAVSAYLASQISPDYKGILENQLEATLMLNFLQANHLDTGDVFREARHTKNFRAISGGTRWIVNKSQPDNNIANADNANAAAQVLLPDTMGEMLNRINTLQNQYDKAIFSLLDKQSQLFSDWLKYIAAAYPVPGDAPTPDVNLIRWFIQTQSIPSLQGVARNLGRLVIETDSNTGNFTLATAPGSPHDSLANRLAWALNGFAQRLQIITGDNQAGVKFSLTPSDAPRYWQPTEPNILITGEVARPTDRYNNATSLPCTVWSESDAPIILNHSTWSVNQAILDKITTLCNDNSDLGYTIWSEAPWNPILLEWAIDVFPLQKNQAEGSLNTYPGDFILSNYDLLNGAEDLSLKQGKGQVEENPLHYVGQSILTPYASKIQYDAIFTTLYADVMPAYLEANPNIVDSEQNYLTNPDHVQSLGTWYRNTYLANANAETTAQDPYYTMIQALNLLETTNFLSQNLSGFNAALLQHESIYQTPLGDPLGAAAAQDFTNLVATHVGDSNRLAPLPQNPFSPIRSGEFKLTALKIIDTFGQSKTLDVNTVITTENMRGDTPDLIHLQPRIVQPARLQFRWLSADDTTMEMNDMPDTNAICGWLVPNHLDEALAVYNAYGKALGEIVPSADAVLWVPAPNSNEAIYDITLIGNTHLQKTVAYLLAQDAAYINALLETIADAQGNIDPTCYEYYTNKIFLLGQPIAIIRAMVGIEVLGETAVDQSWDALRADFNRNHTRSTANVEDILFPARLGKYEQLNDGLIGYWTEDHGSLTDLLYAPQSNLDPQNNKIKTLANAQDADFCLPLSISGEPVYTTILMDPRANVHATSGILPAKAINIPPGAYAFALSQMEISFLSAPIIMHTNATEIALPEEAGYTWSWLERNRNGWNIVDQNDILTPRAAAVFSGPQRVVEGWLKLSKSDS